MTTSIQTNIKPINDFAAAMAEIEHWKEKFEDLQSQITDLRRASVETIIIKDGGTARYIRICDIIMLEADSCYSTIHLTNMEHILTSKTLKHWIAKLGSHADFIRPHRSFLVNKKHMVSYHLNPRKIMLTGKLEVPMACNFIIKE